MIQMKFLKLCGINIFRMMCQLLLMDKMDLLNLPCGNNVKHLICVIYHGYLLCILRINMSKHFKI